MNEILQIIVAVVIGLPVFSAVAAIFAWGAWNVFLAPLFEFALIIVLGEPGYKK